MNPLDAITHGCHTLTSHRKLWDVIIYPYPISHKLYIKAIMSWLQTESCLDYIICCQEAFIVVLSSIASPGQTCRYLSYKLYDVVTIIIMTINYLTYPVSVAEVLSTEDYSHFVVCFHANPGLVAGCGLLLFQVQMAKWICLFPEQTMAVFYMTLSIDQGFSLTLTYMVCRSENHS